MQKWFEFLSINNVRWVPDLSESVYSLFLHIQCPNHRVSSSFENGLTIYFPEFHTQAIVGTTDIYLDAVPCYEVMSTSVDLQEIDTTPVSSTCNHITQFQTDIDIESSKIDQLLLSLRRYYNDVKTKRQLNLEVPAGFRRRTQWQTDAACHDSLEHSTIQHCSDNVPDVSSITDLPSTILESTFLTLIQLMMYFKPQCRVTYQLFVRWINRLLLYLIQSL
jgi:hypothetical protein